MYAAFGNKLNNEKSFGLRPEVGMVDYYSEVVSWGRVDKLIYLNFLPLLLNIDRQSLLSDFSSLIVEKYAIDLLSAFLYRPILDINGKDWSNEIGGIPMCCCLLSNLLLNHVMRVFDPIFLSKFPNQLDIYMKHSCRLLKKSHSPLSICCLF